MTEDAPSTRLMWLTMGYQVSQAIHVAATIGADLLRGGPRHSADLAIATGMHPPSLYRLLRALATVEVFREHPIGQFALTPMGECLCATPCRREGMRSAMCTVSIHGSFAHSARKSRSCSTRL